MADRIARTALVTGANGFVGAHVVRALAARGTRVRALVREGADLRALDEVACDLVRGDLRDPGAVARAAIGCAEITTWARTIACGSRTRRRCTKPTSAARAT
jgi:uncharacterized protein YbjT (DUF2867 family)